MKRFVSLLFAFLVAAVSFAAPSHAGLRPKTYQIDWHTSVDVANGVPYFYGDSAYMYRGVGVTTATTQPIDTSMAIPLRQFQLPPRTTTTTVMDTVTALLLDVFPVIDDGSPTISADTCHVLIQVSNNASTWTGVTFTGPAISPLQASMAAAAVVETGTSNCFELPIRQVVGGVTGGVWYPLGRATVNANQLLGWKYMRVLLQGDFQGKYDAEITGWVDE